MLAPISSVLFINEVLTFIKHCSFQYDYEVKIRKVENWVFFLKNKEYELVFSQQWILLGFVHPMFPTPGDKQGQKLLTDAQSGCSHTYLVTTALQTEPTTSRPRPAERKGQPGASWGRLLRTSTCSSGFLPGRFAGKLQRYHLQQILWIHVGVTGAMPHGPAAERLVCLCVLPTSCSSQLGAASPEVSRGTDLQRPREFS